MVCGAMRSVMCARGAKCYVCTGGGGGGTSWPPPNADAGCKKYRSQFILRRFGWRVNGPIGAQMEHSETRGRHAFGLHICHDRKDVGTFRSSKGTVL